MAGNNSVDNLQWALQQLSSEHVITRLVVFDSHTNYIVADSKLTPTSGTVTRQLSPKELTHFEHSLIAQPPANSNYTFFTLESSASGLDTLSSLWLMITVNPAAIQTSFLAQPEKVTALFIVGFLVSAIGIYWTLRRVLIHPLQDFVSTVQGQYPEGYLPLIDHHRNDDLGKFADAYNNLVQDNFQHQKELVAYNQELALARDQADVASQAKSNFLASMSHEIRTPLNGILGMLQLLETSPLSADQKYKVDMAKTSGESLLALICDILDFSKIEADKMQLEQAEFDLRKAIGDTVESMAFTAQSKNVELILDLTDIAPSRVCGDVTRLKQILINLVSNAIKFTEHGEVVVTARLTDTDNGHQLTCAIKDSGIGIPDEKIATLFDTFTQVDASTTRKYGGTGLGLAITQRLCKLMNGTVSVASDIGKGSTFTFSANLTQAENSQPITPAVNPDGVFIIVLSKDHSLSQSLLRQCSHWGITTLNCDSFYNAASLVEQYPIANSKGLVLVDIALFEKNRNYHLATLKQSPLSRTDVVLMTGIDHIYKEQQLHDWGFACNFPKPVTTENLFKVFALSDQAASPRLTPQAKAAEQQAPTQGHAINVLLVEDDAINQEVFVAMLEQYHVHITIAQNGLEAVTLLHHNPNFDLVFMDCQMPIMDGYQATLAIRASQQDTGLHHIPIIALTANALDGDHEKCRNSGMNAYLTKPINTQKFQATLAEYLSFEQTASLAKGKPKHNTDATGAVQFRVWDRRQALELLQGNQERLQQMVQLYFRQYEVIVSELQQDFKLQDMEQLKHGARTIVGVAGSLSLNRVMQCADQLERACAIPDTNNLSQLVDEVVQELAQAHSLLQSYYPQPHAKNYSA